jgi:GH24 family phage-related lysozyme (muramidase)
METIKGNRNEVYSWGFGHGKIGFGTNLLCFGMGKTLPDSKNNQNNLAISNNAEYCLKASSFAKNKLENEVFGLFWYWKSWNDVETREFFVF